MRNSEFLTSVVRYFGPVYAQVVLHDLRLQAIGSQTPGEALEEGEDPQRIWDAVCAELRLPEDARFPHRSDFKR